MCIAGKGKLVDIVYFDIQKVFVKVPHKRLLNLIQVYEIECQVYIWIKKFLPSTKQPVTVDSQTSE